MPGNTSLALDRLHGGRHHGQAVAQRRALGNDDLVALTHHECRLSRPCPDPPNKPESSREKRGKKQQPEPDAAPEKGAAPKVTAHGRVSA